MAYLSLHNHTEASNIRFLDSINRPAEMVEKAISLGFSGMAFTDHEALCEAVTILKLRDKIKDKHPDFKFIFGNEIYLIDQTEIKNTDKYYHFILLAKDIKGWEQLRTLSSRAWERGYMERGIMRVPTTYQDIEEVVGTDPGHLLAATACLGGFLPLSILNHNVREANEFVQWCIKVFGKENFALELQPSDNEEQIKVNQTLIKFSAHYDIPYIITTDSHYLNKEDFAVHSAFLNSKQTDDRETDKFYRFTYVMSEEEMSEILKIGGLSEEEIRAGFNNTVIFTQAVESFDFRHSTIVPKIQIPEFSLSHLLYNKGYRAIDLFYDSTDEQDLYLMYQIERGIVEKHVTIDQEKLERINTELDVLHYISNRLNQSLSAYLNLTVNIIDIAWQVSLVAPGRGSSTGFYINYLIGIVQVNPLKYGLKYWRFLNKERVELPDVDSDFQPEKVEDIIKLLRQEYGEDNVLNCATFKTESLKSAILTAMRGLGYNNDDAQALAAQVPSHRGATYTLKECLEGDEEKGFEPVPGFKESFTPYPGVFEAVQKIEGIQTNASIHASALYVFNDGYLAQNSLMRAPNGTKITAFSMHDSDDMGALKMDVLRTDAQSKIAKCLDLLLKDKQIEWQGTLRKTYNKYLHPDVLDYDNPHMWSEMSAGKIANLFQFETMVGSTCIKKSRPTNVMQLAEINSIMRLQSEGNEQPIDRYVRFRNNPDAWDLEMLEEGLTPREIDILKKYLSASYGVSGSQEVLMQILMDPEITGFTLGEANAARKAIAKKVAEKLIQLKKDFYSKGEKITRKEFLDYIWTYDIEPQLGYSFSINHTLPYSIIAVQESNLASRWNILYWQCACLCVNAGNYVKDIEGDEEEEPEEVETVEEKTTKRAAPNYGKIAKAIADAQHEGVVIELPSINEAQVDFVPDIENNSIAYSLQSINVVSQDLQDAILSQRPFTSIEDFIEKVQPTIVQMTGLIKSGCFDRLCKKDRRAIMGDYLRLLAQKECPPKDKLTTVQLKKALELNISLPEFTTEIRLFKYKKYIDVKQADKVNKRYILTEPGCIKFFKDYLESDLNLSKGEYDYLPEGKVMVKESAFKRVFDKKISAIMDYLNTDEGKAAYQNLVQSDYINGIKEKYCQGTLSAWEMETMSFYFSGHELKNLNYGQYGCKSFFSLPEYSTSADMCAIAGTVTDYNNTKHIVSLLTPEGIVDVKFFKDAYAKYNRKISVIDKKTNKKTVIEDSWFKRGTKIIVYGLRKENMFHCRSFRFSTDYGTRVRMVGLIDKIYDSGLADIKFQRAQAS